MISKIVIFTDLDGTLLHNETFKFEKREEASVKSDEKFVVSPSKLPKPLSIKSLKEKILISALKEANRLFNLSK